MPLFQECNQKSKGKIMEKQTKLSALLEKRDELVKAIKEKQKELDCFDASEYYSEEDYIKEMRKELGAADVVGGYGLYHIDIVYKLDYTSFRNMYNNYLDELNKYNFDEYKEMEDELAEVEKEIEQLENE